jgi:sugar O-acyltransferase (sialic acid O-acetyltransferase NeuD family)
MENKNFRFIYAPQLGVNDSTIRTVAWKIKPFEKCNAGKKIVEIETTKSVYEVDVQADVFVYPLTSDGEETKIEKPIAICSDNLEDLKDGLKLVSEEKEESTNRKVITEKAKELIKRLNLNEKTIREKLDGKVIREIDIKKYFDEINNESFLPDSFLDNSQKPKVMIYGAGAGGQVAREIINLNKRFDLVGYLDDSPSLINNNMALPIYNGKNLEGLANRGIKGIFIAIASSQIRASIRQRMEKAGIDLITLIHPRAYISDSAIIGCGSIVKAGAIIDSNVYVGNYCIIDNNVTLAHDSKLEDGVHLAPGVSTGGFVTVKKWSIVGIGSSIGTNITLGENCIVSPGSSVVFDVDDNSIIEGVPGKIIGIRK